MKRTFAIILFAALLASLIISASAEGAVTFTETFAAGENGGGILTLSVPANSGITALGVTVKSGPDVLVKSVTRGRATDSGNNVIEGNRFSYQSLVPLEGGEVLKVELYSATSTAANLDVSFEITGAKDSDGNPVECFIEETAIENPALGNEEILQQGRAAYEETTAETTAAAITEADTTSAMVIPQEEIDKEMRAIYGDDYVATDTDEADVTSQSGDKTDGGETEKKGEKPADNKPKAEDGSSSDGFTLFLKIAVPVTAVLVAAAVAAIIWNATKNKKSGKTK